MSFLNFLNTATVEAPKNVRVHTGVGGVRKPWNPADDILAIRVWKDGSCFPSKALIDRFNLEYRKAKITKGEEVPYSAEALAKFQTKEAEKASESKQAIATAIAEGKEPPAQYVVKAEPPKKYKVSKYEYEGQVPGNGFDVIDSRKWAGYKASGNMLFIAPVSKDEPKVDLFGSTKYEPLAEGEVSAETYQAPISSVYDQGSKTFGESSLVPAIEEVYGIKFDDNNEWVDMIVFDELGDLNINKKFSVPVTLIPKVVDRGAEKGKADYQRRENLTIWGFAPAEILNGSVGQSESEVTDSKASDEVEETTEELTEA